MYRCLSAIRTLFKGSAHTPTVRYLLLALLLLLPSPTPLYALTDDTEPATHALPPEAPEPPLFTPPSVTGDAVEEGQCRQTWPVNCGEGGGGSTGCGGWSVLKDLADSETFPGEGSPHCSTGTRLALPSAEDTQGQPVGAMFDGEVVFSQAGKSRDGRDYGGVVVIKLDLKDGSPQCFLRYMFLDRRDLVKVSKEVKAGQRIGTIAKDNMSRTKRWWQENWPGWQPQVKIDVGCDEALVNLPHFMPLEPFVGGGAQDPKSCLLTKKRFPTPVLLYLVNTEDGGNTACHVDVRKDARPRLIDAHRIDKSENRAPIDLHYVGGVKARGIIERKKTPVFSVFEDEEARKNFFGANRKRTSHNPLFRDHGNYMHSSTLDCSEMAQMYRGKEERSLSPREVRGMLTYCANQYILGRAMYTKIFEQPHIEGGLRSFNPESEENLYKPLPKYLRAFMPPDVRSQYRDLVQSGASKAHIYRVMEDEIVKVKYRDQCQPLHMEKLTEDPVEDYEIRDILHKSWRELLIDWPIEHMVTEAENDTIAAADQDDYSKYPHIIDRKPIPKVRANKYVKYPYERIIDPAHPYSPRHIWEETERERFSNYGVMCAKTPVDIILGVYGEANGDPKSLDKNKRPFKVYGAREVPFQQCIRCRIEHNEKKQACIPDPYSFATPGGCDISYTDGGDSDASKCSEFDLGPSTPPAGVASGTAGFIDYLSQLECQYGLRAGLLHSIATMESSCTFNARAGGAAGAGGMFQFLTSTWAGYAQRNGWTAADRDNPYIAAIAAAQYYAGNAASGQCMFDAMLLGYLCGGSIIDNVVSQGADAAIRGASSACSSQAPGYLSRGFALSGFSDNNGCAAGGPHPAGDGSCSIGSVLSGGGRPTGGGQGGTTGGVSDVFTGTGPGQGAGAGSSLGTFSESGCPDNSSYTPFSNKANTFSGSDSSAPAGGEKVCPAFSFPLPDQPSVLSDYGCYRTTCPTSAGGGPISTCPSWITSCAVLSAYTGPYKSQICPTGPSCGGARIHEGLDLGNALGAPVYAAGAGTVTSISDLVTTISHEGECINPSETKPNCATYSAGVETKYLHMGRERTIVNEGDHVTRCQQVGTEGEYLTEGAPHLHFETHDPNSNMIRSDGYYPFAQDQPLYTILTDASCSGGSSDAVNSNRGICRWALPAKKCPTEQDENTPPECRDLTPPGYLTDYKLANSSPIPLPDPLSPDRTHPGGARHNRGDPFDIDVPGMVHNGVWKECDSLQGANKTLCLFLNALANNSGTPAPSGSGTYINPTPCGPMTDYFAVFHPARGRPHWGVDLGDPLGTPIFAAADGVVSFIGSGGPGSSAGNYVEIRHTDGSYTRYLHLRYPGTRSGICPRIVVGASVVQGQVIGYTGDFAVTNAAHLHFELHIPGSPNPGRGGLANAPADVGPVDPFTNGVPPPDPTNPQCPTWTSMECDGTASGLPSAPGGGPQLCLDHPCTLRYDEADLTSQCAFPEDEGGCRPLGHFSQSGHYSDSDDSNNGDCCYNMTRPVTPMNILKLRPVYDEKVHPAKWEPGGKTPNVPEWLSGAWVNPRTDAEEGGVPEGYTFKEYFLNHHPYMRWWDTGAESAQLLQNHMEAESNDGHFDALVGVGIEKHNCGIGGWGDPDKLDPNTSWLELKLYQARTQTLGLHCIGRYEKIFKPGAAEDRVLREAGGTFATRVGAGTGLGLANIPFPMGWRGYVSEPKYAYRFPWFVTLPRPQGSSGGSYLGYGIDLARPGDILIWDKHLPSIKEHKRLPHVAYVSSANTDATVVPRGQEPTTLTPKRFTTPRAQAEATHSVTVVDYNYGKYPDTCGTTNWWKMGPERTLYRDALSPETRAMGAAAGVTNLECTNTDLAQCVEPDWNEVLVYRPHDGSNIRQ